ILLTTDGAVKVTDFGIALAWNDTEQLTRTGAVMGTATYFSPEQAQGLSADHRTDIYSLGVVLYELLAGRPPFSGESPVAVAYQHVREEPVPLRAIAPTVPEGLEAIVMTCLAKDPDGRYRSAGDLVADLDRFLAGDVPAALGVASIAAQETAAVAGVLEPARPGDPYLAREPASYDEPGRSDRSTVIAAVVGGVALLALGVVLLWKLLSPSGDVLTVTIPGLNGQAAPAATAQLEALDLEVIQSEATSTEIGAGFVIETDPAAGQVVDAGSEVTLLVSAGPALHEVPRVLDLRQDEARSALEDEGFVVGEVTLEASLVVDAGLVISQSPAAGQVAEEGSAVSLTISAGETAIEVPDVTGRTERDALFQLAQAGFSPEQIRIERIPSSEVLAEFVIETDPAASESIGEDGIITVFVSEGATPSALPDVTGMEPEAAQEILTELGFIVDFGSPTEVPFGDPDHGRVVSMDPAAGLMAEFGATVELSVGQAPGPVTVPSLEGRQYEVAADLLGAAGLGVSRTDRPITLGHARDGEVFEQDPAAGQEVAPGTVINVVVGVARGEIPSVIGLSPEDAQAVIEAAGLAYERGADVELEPDNPLDGKVASQSPRPTSQTGGGVVGGTVITVNVGFALTDVPDLIGKTVDQLQALIDAAQLILRIDPTTILVDPALAGTVVQQTPETGMAVPKDSEITVIFGRAGSIIPDLEGLTRSETENVMATAGLVFHWDEDGRDVNKCEPLTDPELVGVVAFQDQDPGILVEPGTEITVKIGRLDSDFGCTWTENPS
ncbi:PASTA domain-containing protein, partial [bacterium]|nr:PASTA domain-containing protein [bacterium]